MSFKVSDNKKYTKIWERVSNLMNTKFDSKPVYGDNDKYIETKIKVYGDKISEPVYSDNDKYITTKIMAYGDKINRNF